jgi:MFS transporter, putative metabolite:H+ symporter
LGGSLRDVAMPEPMAPRDPGIAARMDALPVTWLHIAVVFVSAMGLLFDVVEAALGNALSAVFSAPPHHVDRYQLSLLLGSVFAGGAIGAPLLGWLADHQGRRRALGIALWILTVTSLLAATTSNVTTLTIYRTLSGLALGAYPPLVVAYLSDVLPPKQRGMLTLLTGAIGFLGAPAVIFLIRWLTPLQPLGLEGWRWALIVGAVGSAATGLMFLLLPESPRFLSATGRRSLAEAACRRFERAAGLAAPSAAAAGMVSLPGPDAHMPPRERFWAPESLVLRKRAVLLSALYFLGPWATIGFPVLSGAVLVEKGFRVSDSLLYLGVSLFGPSIGSLLGALVIDRVERRTALMLGAGFMALIGLAFAASGVPLWLMILGVLFNMIASLYVSVQTLYDAELFPTELRALVSSGTWAVNRIVSAVVPLALLPVLKTSGPMAMFTIIAGALVASLVIVLTFGPRGLARKPIA